MKILKNILIGFLSILIIISTIFGISFYNNNNKLDTDYTLTQGQIVELPSDSPKPQFPENLLLTIENIGVPVLYYHSVDPSESNEVIISPEKLKQQLQYIVDSGYYPITLTQLYDHLTNNKAIPEKSILITFDDGYMDNYTNAFPILKELDIKATIFVISDVIDNGYNLSTEQIKEMDYYGIDIASHTGSHPNLLNLNYDQQLDEIKRSKEKLESILGKEVTSFAYPYGDYNADSIKAIKESGYKMAFTTNRGLADRNDSLLELDRIYVSSKYSFETFKERLKSTKK
ncbi:MAG: polysaccharide deacetylase family protein [Clostridium sp.]